MIVTSKTKFDPLAAIYSTLQLNEVQKQGFTNQIILLPPASKPVTLYLMQKKTAVCYQLFLYHVHEQIFSMSSATVLNKPSVLDADSSQKPHTNVSFAIAKIASGIMTRHDRFTQLVIGTFGKLYMINMNL